MRPKIGYDARMIEHSGIGVRIQHILKLWPIPETEAELFVFGDKTLLSRHELPKHAIIIDYSAKIYSIREWLGHSKMREMDYLDIPHFNIPIFFVRKCIVTIHDLILYHFRSVHSSFIKRIYLNFVLRWIAFFAYRILTVSEYTKRDFHIHFKRELAKIEVIYNGIEPKIFYKRNSMEVENFRREQALPNEYLLSIGIGKKHKNFDFLIENLVSLWKNNLLDTPIVLGGMSKDIPLDLLEIKKQYPDRLFFLPHLPYAELPLLYQSAKLFIFPSLMEGFGFPVIEAQSVGTPVFSSNASVLPEILEDSASFFDPRNGKDFQEKLISLLANPKQLLQISEAGLANFSRFRWEDQIRNLAVFYKNCFLK